MAESNAPERVKVVVGESGRPVAIHRGLPLLVGSALGEVVDAAAYDRVVAERDEAQTQRDALHARHASAVTARNKAQVDRAKERVRADRYRKAARALARIATGEVSHDFQGRCPSGPGDGERDPTCPACRLLSEWDETRFVLAEGEQPAGETERESMPREAREAAIRRAAETVRSGSGWVQRAGVQSATETEPKAAPDVVCTVCQGNGMIPPNSGSYCGVCDGSGVVPAPSTTETATGGERAHLTTFTVEFWFSDTTPTWSVRQQHSGTDRQLRGSGDARSDAIDGAVVTLRSWAAEPWPEVPDTAPSDTAPSTTEVNR